MVIVGIVNYFMDDFHSTHYTQWLNEVSGGKVQVRYCFALAETPPEDHQFPVLKRSTDQWCSDLGVTRCASVEELIRKCDAIMINTPDYSEMHEQLCQIPLTSGKPVFVDKVFTTTFESAKGLFKLANTHKTPLFSSSCLRYLPEFVPVDTSDIVDIACWWHADDVHIIHQIELNMMLMRGKVKRLMAVPGNGYIHYAIEFVDGRMATMAGWHTYRDIPLVMNIYHACNRHETITVTSDVFHDFVIQLVDYFLTGEEKVKQEDTINIIGVYEAAIEAGMTPGKWIPVKQV